MDRLEERRERRMRVEKAIVCEKVRRKKKMEGNERRERERESGYVFV